MAVLRWMRDVFKQWMALVTGGALIGFVALFSELSGIIVPPRIYEIAIVINLFAAMFLAWREQERMRLAVEASLREYTAPSLELKFRCGVPFLQPSTLSDGRHAMWIRILPTTATRVERCVGYLDDVDRQVGINWERIGLNGRLALWWSDIHEQRLITGERPLEAREVTIVPGSPQFLDIAYFIEGENILRIAADQISIEALQVLIHDRDDAFRFSIRVIGEPHVNKAARLQIRRTGRWDAPEVTVIAS
jgi:hypothetical protein